MTKMRERDFPYLYERLGYGRYSVLRTATKDWFVQWQQSGRTIPPSDVNKVPEVVACAKAFPKEKGGLFWPPGVDDIPNLPAGEEKQGCH